MHLAEPGRPDAARLATRVLVPLLALLSLSLSLSLPQPAAALGSRDSAALAAMSAFADGRSGLVVWQSRRSGPLRIFACDLDGANLRQLSPDVSGKDHLAPLISPDGTRVLYYQTATLSSGTYYDDHLGQMMLVPASGGGAQQLLPEVRTYFECRFARWIDDNTIAYIGADHHGYTLSLANGQSSKLFDYPLGEFGALPNRQLTYAIDGFNRVFELKAGAAIQRQDFDGCEGNMSADGAWAYRVKGSSHDFMRMALGSWQEELILANHDSALPAGQNYIYFPQLSACQRFLAFGASANVHDHFNADYDIFVLPVDPVTFLKTGPAVKYSFDKALDSYPDIWVAPDEPILRRVELTAPAKLLQPGSALPIQAALVDQHGQPFAAQLSWSVSGGGSLEPTAPDATASEASAIFRSDGSEGRFTIRASAQGIEGTLEFEVLALTFPLKINCGDNAYDAPGWVRDDAYVSGGADWTNPNAVNTSGVSSPAPAVVYKSVRRGSPHSYSLPLYNGTYSLRLHFADAYSDRSMHYTIEGLPMLTDFDITSRAGGVNRAYIEELQVTVSDGDGLQIDCQSEDDVFEAGIEVHLLSVEQPDLPDAAVGAGADAGGPALDASRGPPARAGSQLGGGCAVADKRAPPPAWLLLAALGCLLRRRLRGWAG